MINRHLSVAFFINVLWNNSMTIISTKPQQNIDTVDGSFVPADVQLKSFPPLDDTIVFIKEIDWAEVGQRCRGGINNVGLVVAVCGEKLYTFGEFLAKV